MNRKARVYKQVNRAGLLRLSRVRRSAIYQPLAALLAVLLIPSFSWFDGSKAFQSSAQIVQGCGSSRGNLILQSVCVNGSPGPVDDLNQLETDAVGAYLTAHSLPASDASLIYSEGRTDLRDAIRGSMLTILLGIISKPAAARTAHEQALYNWLQFAVQQNEIAEYTAALTEYQKWRNDPCHFQLDPTIASQYGLSYNGLALCEPQTVATGGLQVPAASYFTAFGLENSYGKAAQTTPDFATVVAETQINMGEMFGIALSAGAVLGAAAGLSTAAFFASIFPFALGGLAPELSFAGWGAAAFATGGTIAGVGAGVAGGVLLCVVVGVVAGFQVFNNQDQLNQLNNLTNLLAQARNNPPDLNAFVADTTGLGSLKLNETLVAQTLPDVPSTAALPAHKAGDPLVAVTPGGGTPTVANSFVYSDWNGIGWRATTVGGWLAQVCMGDSSGQNCPRQDSFIASIHYVDWSGANMIASRLGGNFTIVKSKPASADKPCPADSSTGVTPGTDFSNCSSYVASQIQYTHQGSQYTMELSQAPTFTGSTTLYFTWLQPGGATVTATGFPTPTISQLSFSFLPPGVAFESGAAGTGTASFLYVGGGAPGTYRVTLVAQNGRGAIAQNFTIVIATKLQITSPDTLHAVSGQPVSFLVTTTGFPAPSLFIDPALVPAGLSFHDKGNGTATITGTAFGQSFSACIVNGPTDCKITARNGQGFVTQSFDIIVNYPPQPRLVSTAATFLAGAHNSVQVRSTGATTPVTYVFNQQGASWLGFHDNGDGTGVLSGTPPEGSSGSYGIVVVPESGGVPVVEIPNYTISVIGRPQFVTPNLASFVVGEVASFEVFTNRPIGLVTATGTLPSGLGFAPNGNGSGTLVGMPAVGSGGFYTLHLSYLDFTNFAETATQDLNVAVNEAPAFTSAPFANFYAGQENAFAVTVSGYPALSSAPVAQGQTAANYVAGMEFTVSGLPADLTYGNLNPEGFNTGTLTLRGTPSRSDAGQHVVTITASNEVGVPVTQTLILNIGGAPGDVNGDGSVTCVDFSVVKASFGKYRGQPGYNPAADVNNDGVVNIQDLSIVARDISKGTACR